MIQVKAAALGKESLVPHRSLAAILSRFIPALLAILVTWLPTAAAAEPFGLVAARCFAVTDSAQPSPADACTFAPKNYQQRWLWLTIAAPKPGPTLWRLTVRQSRFDRVVAHFNYADGTERRLSAAAGDFGSHWRIGGKLAFDPPVSAAPVTSISIGFERLAAHGLLRIRLTPVGVADRFEDVATLVAGAALALLGFAAAYNLGIGFGGQRRFALWHAAWAACVFGWGLLWTQVALFAWPGLAGPTAVGMSILLSSAAIGCAGRFFVTSVEPGVLPRYLALAVTLISATIATQGLIGGLGPREWLTTVGGAFGVTVLTGAATLVLSIAVAIRAGSRAARDFAISWLLPIAAVVWTFVADRGLTADDDSGQLLVLAACALQTVGLSHIVGRRLALVRVERDEAQAREAQFKALADTDPLTGLYNRRGFVSRVETALAGPRPVALILLDLDHFKAVNDGFGHDAGDRVLFSVAAALRALSGEAIVGRLGGEEFGVCICDLSGPALAQLAERLRHGIAGLERGSASGGPAQVTASFGIAEAGTAAGFEALYREADRALYRAKELGRNRVSVGDPMLSLAS